MLKYKKKCINLARFVLKCYNRKEGTMKKRTIVILLIIIAFLTLISYIYYSYLSIKANRRETTKINSQYESYCEKEIFGTDLASLINKAIDSNERNDVKKDENEKYYDNNANSIEIHIKFKDSDEIFDMERIYKLGIDRFILNYNQMKFKCQKIEYHSKTSNIKYMYFEEI